jgi:hypothetical protein
MQIKMKMRILQIIRKIIILRNLILKINNMMKKCNQIRYKTILKSKFYLIDNHSRLLYLQERQYNS